MRKLKFAIPVIILVILVGLFPHCGKDSAPQQKIYNMTNMEIDSMLQVVSQRNMTISERINYYSEAFLGMPYKLKCAGDGPYALYEPWPLVNFDETNCMVFCEHTLALAISDSWDNFFNNLQKIRYKDGIIGMRTRNHYTIADWRPENSWLLNDVTAEIGGNSTVSITRTISHKQFFKDKGIRDLRYVKADRELTVDVIPKKELMDIKDKTRPGDILSLIFAEKDSIFSAHMLMIAEKNGDKFIRESSNSKMTTFDTPYDQWVNEKEGMDRYLGIVIMRVREELDQPGKVILPWKIDEIKAGLEE
ncbi:MAG TPA: N-acetylmuramoyl-L-alanine amidase-like domain-containing protein [bacterium]|nr:N-acetylmuramoyl-L-alanine amidase-like domain-containing protein [bacterium]